MLRTAMMIMIASAMQLFLSTPRVSDLSPASLEMLTATTGRDEGQCCGTSTLCERVPEVANCVPAGFSNCDCSEDGTLCSKVVQAPSLNQVCIQPQSPQPGWSCSYLSNTWCYRVQFGSCDSDAGGFSIWCMCDLCGCDCSANNPPVDMGSRTLCQGTACP